MSAELLTPNFLLLFGDDTDKRLTPHLTGGERRREGEGQWTVVGLYFDEDEAFEAFSGWQRPLGYGPGQLVIAQVEGLARTVGDVRYVVEPLILPKDSFAAHIEVYRRGPRGGEKRYVRLGPRVIAARADAALDDLMCALRRDELPNVRVLGLAVNTTDPANALNQKRGSE